MDNKLDLIIIIMICYYRRASLNATTIQDLMIFRCISKFDLKEERISRQRILLRIDPFGTAASITDWSV
jgi:hypothetical protein